MSELFDSELLDQAAQVLDSARRAGLRIATAETVTGGLVAAALTSVAGASTVFERGFVLYHASVKAVGLGVGPEIAQEHGLVSAAVTEGIANGILEHSAADAGVALTGYAGPTGGNDRDPVGTVYTSAVLRDGKIVTERHVFDGDRTAVKLQAVEAALRLLGDQLGGSDAR
ncbi:MULTISPECIES: CinA family protein [Pseudonocardia]|uniref:Nicotinamide-nucleotide amidohydrolase PncC n=2 Tax=Pseudonocardia TaxID=1847 RepID=A0A1Y2MR87_PSEAH|nr:MULTISPECIES: CinA family protein [Pseudonocardia]OSY37736.1 Nicotinamide-nucleotide amidohydrolase PncC [Pseudonocardia autotrophica]TDN75774.1 nicotinamide-nucleotide amidase [Pseudonocardia autotrophica]BBF99745.1 competence damage-inducible protein A [Pseudonocardia autotrophica]GEC27113.1 competence damage-inducible protein A [Pseudonocardia saturnea]